MREEAPPETAMILLRAGASDERVERETGLTLVEIIGLRAQAASGQTTPN